MDRYRAYKPAKVQAGRQAESKNAVASGQQLKPNVQYLATPRNSQSYRLPGKRQMGRTALP